jgi:hypothetical protein
MFVQAALLAQCIQAIWPYLFSTKFLTYNFAQSHVSDAKMKLLAKKIGRYDAHNLHRNNKFPQHPSQTPHHTLWTERFTKKKGHK